jgi:ribosomal-protein-serine acetyltransferase
MKLPEEIQSDRLRIQAWRLDHAPELFGLFDTERERLLRTQGDTTRTRTLEDQEEKIREAEDLREKGKRFTYCIFLKQDPGPDRLAGAIEVHHVIANARRGEFGYWLGAEFESQGIMSEAITAMERACWEAGFHHIQIRCATHNSRSSAVPRRLGYTLDGRIREAWFHLEEWHDELVFTKLQGE